MAQNIALMTLANESVPSLFVQQYCEDRIHYCEALKIVKEKCDQVLSNNGIHHAIESRTKEPKSLRDKLAKFERQRGFPYQTLEDIKKDIVDLAGVCILVHIPSERIKAAGFLKEAFEVEKAFDHPKDGDAKGGKLKDLGYVATHLHIFLKNKDLDDSGLDHAGGKLVEIQVIYTNMRGWSNVEHDMRYKPSHKVMRAQLQKLRAKRMLVGIDEELHEQLEEDVAHRVAKENRILKSLDEVGSFLQKWLEEHHGAWFQDQTAGSCTSLFNFLETRNMSTRRELRQVLEETFSCNSEAAYSSLASQYPTGSLTLVIFIMDRLLLTDDESDSPDSFTGNDHKTHVWKLRAMMSTIVWLDRLFVPPLKWQQVFAAQNQKFLRGAFFWLNSSRQGFFLEGSLLGQDDIVILDELWSWFEHQTDRQIRLTFAMSKNGMLKNRRDLGKVVLPLIHGLGHSN